MDKKTKNNLSNKIGVRVNLYLPEDLFEDYKKVKNYLKDNDSSLSRVFQDYIIKTSMEVK